MSNKKKIVDLTPGTELPKGVVRPVSGIVPVGNQILVERINASELVTHAFTISTKDEPSNQGYILAIGPLVNKDLGLKVGDRVLMQGTTPTFVPNFNGGKRELNLMLPDIIKGVIVEG